MAIERLCKICGTRIIAYTTLQNKCRDCTIKNAKPIAQRGKQAKMWKTFREQIAIPYLDKRYGHVCSINGCNETNNLDIDHMKTRGSRPDLRYDVKNLRYVCRDHHRAITDGRLK